MAAVSELSMVFHCCRGRDLSDGGEIDVASGHEVTHAELDGGF